MLAEWERQQPGRSETMFAALQNVAPSQLADRALFDFASMDAAAPESTPASPPSPPSAVEIPIRWLDRARSPP